jgi:hypothetical protein
MVRGFRDFDGAAVGGDKSRGAADLKDENGIKTSEVKSSKTAS